MKKLTKMIALLLVATFAFASAVHATESTYVYQEENIEIRIPHNGLSEEKLLHISQLLLSGETNTDTQTYGLMCTLFGHKLVTAETQVITHMVYDTYPYCECEYYEVTICERNNCNYSEIELLSIDKVGCCVP